MNRSTTKKLDRLFQQTVLEPSCKLCGRDATVVHNIIGRRHLSTRWWKPNGLSLCHYCHMSIESGLITYKPNTELQRRANRIAKNIDSKRVIDYLNNKIEDYL